VSCTITDGLPLSHFEAMAAGVPVLGFAWGGNLEMIEHGKNGYLAKPGNIDDLREGLEYCITHREVLGKNAREMVKKWTWPKMIEKVAEVYRMANEPHPYAGQTSIVIPVYNYEKKLLRAVESAVNQTHKPLEVLIVDDGSTDGSFGVAEELALKYDIVKAHTKPNAGVATARNLGIDKARGEYITCLDADDKIHERFLEICKPELDKNPSLGIAYTGIFAISPKSEGISTWPEECDHDAQMKYRNPNNPRGKNQVPTCCLFRRKMWERTGGYKQRYAPLGAGSEDAEFFTRAMSIGFSAKKITNKGLFIYSYATGLISGNREKAEPDLVEPPWLALHPWAKDGKHPFASLATPQNKLAHPVYQYDRPLVSIVIPVGKGHEQEVFNALDSIEAQTYRNWEVIVAWDSDTEHDFTAYPYVKVVKTGSGKGAGYSRNRGAEKAVAPFLVFLDADDQLAPEFFEKSLVVFQKYKSIVYTDYVNSVVTNEEGLRNFEQNDIIKYNKRTQVAMIGGQSSDYDCERAQRQPSKDMFHWCLVTCLIPKVWHDNIGGFDEWMESFEDVLYHWVMARKGYCYTRLPEQLVNYRMHTGTRREKASIYTEQGRKVAKKMLQYSKQVLEEIEPMGCKKCPGGRTASPSLNVIAEKAIPISRAADENFVEVEYIHPNRGNHHVYGAVTKTWYGYRSGGATLLVHKNDIVAQPQLFRPIVRQIQNIIIEPQKQPTAPPEEITQDQIERAIGIPIPKAEEKKPEVQTTPPPIVLNEEGEVEKIVVKDESDFSSIPGVTPGVHRQLETLGCATRQDVLELGYDGLIALKGVGEVRAEMIVQFLSIKGE